MSTYKGVVTHSRNEIGSKQKDATMRMVEWPLSSGTIELIDPATLSLNGLKRALKAVGQADLLKEMTEKDELLDALVEQLWCDKPIEIHPTENHSSVLKELRANSKIEEINKAPKIVKQAVKAGAKPIPKGLNVD